MTMKKRVLVIILFVVLMSVFSILFFTEFELKENLPFVSSQPQEGEGGPIAQPLPIPRDPKTFLKIPFRCDWDTTEQNDIILDGAVYVEGGDFSQYSMFNDFYYPRCYGTDDNCNIEKHTVRLLDEEGKVVDVGGTIGLKAQRTFNVDCFKMQAGTYYAYVPYSPGMDVVSVQLDSEDKICVAGLNPSVDFSKYYIFDSPDIARSWCEGGWGWFRGWEKNGAYLEIAEHSYYNPDREGTYGWVFSLNYRKGNCDDTYFVGEVNYDEKYPHGTLHGKNTLVSITHPYYGEIEEDGTKIRGGGKYCNGMLYFPQ